MYTGYFEAQIIPDLANEIPFKLASVAFCSVFIILWAFP